VNIPHITQSLHQSGVAVFPVEPLSSVAISHFFPTWGLKILRVFIYPVSTFVKEDESHGIIRIIKEKVRVNPDVLTFLVDTGGHGGVVQVGEDHPNVVTTLTIEVM